MRCSFNVIFLLKYCLTRVNFSTQFDAQNAGNGISGFMTSKIFWWEHVTLQTALENPQLRRLTEQSHFDLDLSGLAHDFGRMSWETSTKQFTALKKNTGSSIFSASRILL
jgi:hypothetical protein